MSEMWMNLWSGTFVPGRSRQSCAGFLYTIIGHWLLLGLFARINANNVILQFPPYSLLCCTRFNSQTRQSFSVLYRKRRSRTWLGWGGWGKEELPFSYSEAVCVCVCWREVHHPECCRLVENAMMSDCVSPALPALARRGQVSLSSLRDIAGW